TEPRKLPMMPIREMVIFPYMMTPFVVGRLSSVRALEEALNGDRKIFLATQHDASIDEPKAKEIYQVGSICNIVQSVKMPDGNIKVLVEGVERAKSIDVTDRDGFFVATVRTGKTEFEMTPGPGVDRSRRQYHVNGSASARRQGQAHHHRPAWRRDAGVRAGRAELHPWQGAGAWTEPRVLSQRGSAPARARRRDSEGWSFGRHHNGHGAG